MTISTTTSRWDYTGTGATDTYNYTTYILEKTDLVVTQTDTSGVESTLTVDTDYTVSGVGNDTGGSITLTAGNLSTGVKLTIRKVRPLTQETDIRNQGAYYPENIENEFDRGRIIDQQLQEQVDRSMKLAVSEPASGFNMILPTGVTGSVSKAPVTNASGNGWADPDDWPTASDIENAESYANQAAISAAAAAVSAGTLSPYGINNLGLSASVAANALTISLKEADGTSDPGSGTDSVTIYFRSTTATSGAMVGRSVSSALSITVPSGATLGHNDALADWIYVYALDNSGTVELAVSSSRHWNEGEVQSTSAIGNGSDDSNTLYSTTARSNVPIRLIGRMLSSQTTAGTYAASITRIETGFLFNEYQTVSRAADFEAKHGNRYAVSTAAARTVTLGAARAGWESFFFDSTGSGGTNVITLTSSVNIQGSSNDFEIIGDFVSARVWSDGSGFFVEKHLRTDDSYVEGSTPNGHGSTNTMVRRWTNTTTVGGAITYADSAANGMSLTINEDGLYFMEYSDGNQGADGSAFFGIAVNATGTTGITSLTFATGKRANAGGGVTLDNGVSHVSALMRLSKNDVVTTHTDNNVTRTDDEARFCIVKVG